MKKEGRGGGSELGSDLDLDPDPWKILRIRIRQNDADPMDPDPQHCFINSTFIGDVQYMYCIVHIVRQDLK